MRRAARGQFALSKNHSRILPLTFLHFARTPQGRRGVLHRPRRGATRGLRTDATGVPPSDFVCRHARPIARSRRALKDRFSDSLTRVVSEPLLPPSLERGNESGCLAGTSGFCTCRRRGASRIFLDTSTIRRLPLESPSGSHDESLRNKE